MSPAEADRYREALKQNPELLDDETRAIIEREHLLDPPAPKAPPSDGSPDDNEPAPEVWGLMTKKDYRNSGGFQPKPPPAREPGEDDDLERPELETEPQAPGRSPFPKVAAVLGGIAVLVIGLVTAAIISRAGQPGPAPAPVATPAKAAALAPPTPSPSPVPPAISATIPGLYSGPFTVKDVKCYPNGYDGKYEEDYVLDATDSSQAVKQWLLAIVPNLNGSPGFFFALQAAPGKADPNHAYWGSGSVNGQTVTITPGQGGTIDHDIFVVGTDTLAGHLKLIGTCPPGSPGS